MPPILFHSTNGQSPAVNLREALLLGLAPDRGLYLPEKFPKLTFEDMAAFARLPYHEIAFRVLSKYTEGIIPSDALAAMCKALAKIARLPVVKGKPVMIRVEKFE